MRIQTKCTMPHMAWDLPSLAGPCLLKRSAHLTASRGIAQKHRIDHSQPSCRPRAVQVGSSLMELATLSSSEAVTAATASAGGSPGLLKLLYDATQTMDTLVVDQLAVVTPLTYVIILGAGLVTSLSPCTLSVLPLTIGYIGGYSKNAEGGPANNPALQSASFALGLATTLALLGVASSFLGRAYGQIGSGAPVAVSLVAILMGLNLLELLPLNLPSLNVDTRAAPVPPAAQAYLAGLTFALAASPCSTPILATLLAYVSSTRDPLEGGALLLAYTTGYVAPLLIAASFTGAVKQLLALRQYSAWVPTASGVLLVTGGTYTLLTRVLPS